jgi:energy-coupling factor transporter ATP-binding protein EcfA2
MNATIEIDGLRKRFGPVQALDGMTFTVQPGQVTGFVGPNGAGKSTTVSVVVGLDAPDAGTATIGERITVRTTARAQAMTALAGAGAEVATTGPDTLTISSLQQKKRWPFSPPTLSPSASSPPTGPPSSRPDAMLVKALNNIFFKHPLSLARPAGAADRSRLPIAGDSASAKAAVTEFIESIGYSVVDAGPLADSWRQATGTPVWGTPYGPYSDDKGQPAGEDAIRAALATATR